MKRCFFLIMVLISGFVPCTVYAGPMQDLQDSRQTALNDTVFSRHEGWILTCRVTGFSEKTVSVLLPVPSEQVEIQRIAVNRIAFHDGRYAIFDTTGQLVEEVSITQPVSAVESPGPGLVKLADGREIVLNGIDLAEPADSLVRYYSKMGADYIESVIQAGPVRLQSDNIRLDDSGRQVEYVLLPGGDVLNAELISRGYYKAATEGVNRYRDNFIALEEEAKLEQRGIWENYVPPPEQEDAEVQQKKPFVEWDIKNIKPRFTFSQTYLDNWLKGGTDAFSFYIFLDNDIAVKKSWMVLDNDLDVRYGKSQIGKGERKITSNLLEIRSTLEFGKDWIVKPIIGGTIKTQLATDYKYYDDEPRVPRSDFWDPVKLTYRYGVSINLVDELKINFTADITEQIAYTDFYAKEAKIDNRKTEILEKRKTTRKMSSYVKYRRNFRGGGLIIDSKINIKSAFKHYSRTTVNWTNSITVRIYKFVSFSFDTAFKYDITKSNRGQYQQITGITLMYDLKEIFKGS